jgi:hypothetical protein
MRLADEPIGGTERGAIPYTLKIGAHVITHDRHLCYHCWLPEGVIREMSVKLTISTLGLSRPTEFLEGKAMWAGLDGTRFEQPS